MTVKESSLKKIRPDLDLVWSNSPLQTICLSESINVENSNFGVVPYFLICGWLTTTLHLTIIITIWAGDTEVYSISWYRREIGWSRGDLSVLIVSGQRPVCYRVRQWALISCNTANPWSSIMNIYYNKINISKNT